MIFGRCYLYRNSFLSAFAVRNFAASAENPTSFLHKRSFYSARPRRHSNFSVLRNSSFQTAFQKSSKSYSFAVNDVSSYFLRPETFSKAAVEFHRCYAKKRKVTHSDSEDSDEEDIDNIVDKYDKSSQVITSHVSSLRIDLIIKTAFGMARNKVEVAFYESRIRLNGEKVLKKSQRAKVGDEIDVIKSVSPVNPDLLRISRVKILSAKADENEEEDEIRIKMRRFKSLQIENYENAPYYISSPSTGS